MLDQRDHYFMLRHVRRSLLRSRLTGTPLNLNEEVKETLIEMFGEEYYNKLLQLAQKPLVQESSEQIQQELKKKLGEERYNELRNRCEEEGKLDAWRLRTGKYPHTCDSKPHQRCMACFIVRTPEIKTVQ